MDTEKLAALRGMIDKSDRIVFFGGAGVSTESGIPDFRSEDGVFRAMQAYGYPPETLLSHDFFLANPEVFYEYYNAFLILPDVRPNAAHRALARLEAAGKLTAVVTQNIDGLHQLAGSQNVLELHGSTQRNFCMTCQRRYALADIAPGGTPVPRCACGGIIRPDVVLYGEMLDDDVVSAAVRHIRAADMLIVGGTSLVVQPAASLLSYFRGDRLVLINKSETPYDRMAALVINDAIGAVLGAAME